MDKATASASDTVSIHFQAKLNDGTVVASSEEAEPVKFEIGSGTLIPGVESAVTGMEIGEHKNVKLEPEEAFGPFHDELVVTLSKNDFPAEADITVGMRFSAATNDGSERVVTVIDVADESVVVDGNHPLAGKDVTFELELVEIH